MYTAIEMTNWRLAIVPHATVTADGFDPTTTEEVLGCIYGTIPATVPGNFELDMLREGLLEDPYVKDNVLQTQKLENRHLWYATRFTVENRKDGDTVLHFGGIDTAAVIYVDGQELGRTENMLIPHEFPVQLADGEHDLVVHILPAQIYSRQIELPVNSTTLAYNFEQLKLRKAPYMYGWDIMPRIVSGGLWRPVEVRYLPKSRIKQTYMYTAQRWENSARLMFHMVWQTEDDLMQEYTVDVDGVCGNSTFHGSAPLYNTNVWIQLPVDKPRFWWPHNYGDPDLYDVTVTLRKGEVVHDVQTFRYGIRTVELKRTSLAGDDGEFVIKVNGQKIFAMGTNWVPTDAFPSRSKDYLLRGLEMVSDLGCNIIRCWGGNLYPDDLLYDYCDQHGILIWQDFSMACGHYPDDERICRLMEEEVTAVVRRLRNHPSLVVWSGDNECDTSVNREVRECGRKITDIDPNGNALTRRVIPAVLRREDHTRPYLPSSPYVDEVAFTTGQPRSEAHPWGPRDFFKGEFYTTLQMHFASEIGYHGCPSPATLRKIFSPEALEDYGDSKRCENPEWLAHGVSHNGQDGYAYRNPLMHSQVERLFGAVIPGVDIYARQSQISQAEAKKFFIESFRMMKWRRTGIIWWNVIDGWPQISDAVVDWYGCKKLAYHYIKRSQQPFCLMCQEPKEGHLTLMAVNDRRQPVTARYTVTEVNSEQIVAQGTCTVQPDEAVAIDRFPEEPNAMYRITWDGDAEGMNHYTASIASTLDYNTHIQQLKKLGFYDEFEGFED
ncbi:MAG: hypothetical protein E7541_05810 [Ruminococcaceae bacterium]|nr:hypothetical protein [Oscillospiraceae bacterium]